MPVNSSSSSSNGCPLDVEPSSINSSYFLSMHCFVMRPSSLVFSMYNITNILVLLPLCSFIIYLGLQRWRQQRSSSAATTSHSDSFTYHMVAIELVGVLGSIICLFGVHAYYYVAVVSGGFFLSITWTGQMFFHSLTCLERYLAVVHPIIYLSLRKERGIRIRNITNACAWLFSITYAGLFMLGNIILDLCVFSVFFVVMVFCSLSVLCVLTRRGPGDQGGDRGRVDQSKQRAFYTIMAILGVLLLRTCWNLLWIVITVLKADCECLITITDLWLSLPSSLVLPVLYLHRSGKLGCCQKNTE